MSKSFGATRALDDVSFEVRAGEIHVLAGENGAGKSTLIRVLSGVITEHEGELLVNGERARFRDARDAARAGIATIHQELSLVGSMTVAENLALASGDGSLQTPRSKGHAASGGLGRMASMFGWVRHADDVRAARRILAGMDLDVDPEALVETLPLSAQQLLEIARALAREARVLVLDEPTSALSEPEAERLLARVEKLAEAGCGVVYISHRMEENDRLADRITVLRDGRVVASRPASELPRAELVALMMGSEADVGGPDASREDWQSSRDEDRQSSRKDNKRSLSGEQRPPSPEGAAATEDRHSPSHDGAAATEPPLLEVRRLALSAPGASPLHDVSFTVGRGEIVGLAGLRGSGTSETLAALFGAFGEAARGDVRLDGAPFTLASPAQSIAQGLVYLANERRKTVLYDLDITENITLSSLARLAEYGLLPLAHEVEIAAEMTGKLPVAAPSLRAPARALSGGNQQKVAVLRCLAAGPKALLFDEPTRGVDIGAKADIHRALQALAAEGKGIVVVTSELPELLSLCDRIVVLRRGHVAATLEKKDFSRDGLRLALDG